MRLYISEFSVYFIITSSTLSRTELNSIWNSSLTYIIHLSFALLERDIRVQAPYSSFLSGIHSGHRLLTPSVFGDLGYRVLGLNVWGREKGTIGGAPLPEPTTLGQENNHLNPSRKTHLSLGPWLVGKVGKIPQRLCRDPIGKVSDKTAFPSFYQTPQHS